MSDAAAERPRAPAVFNIPTHRSFADSLVAGLISRFGKGPLDLARGRILLPNNRAVRAVTDAFVRASGGGLVLPRLIAIGDPELEERIGGALDPADFSESIPPAIDPLARLLALAKLVETDAGGSPAESLRLAADLGRTLDALLIEKVDPGKLRTAADDAGDIARHWQISLQRLQVIIERWPAILERQGRIDLSERRNRLLHAVEQRWERLPPGGFTVAAGITTAAPAVAALLKRVAYLNQGLVVLPGLTSEQVLPEEEWDALEETHPQYHLKLLLDRMGIGRGEVRAWPLSGRAASTAARGRAVAHAMTGADFSDKWNGLKPVDRRLTGIQAVELADPAAEAQSIALALRQAIETPGRTAALVTPDRMLAGRVSALLRRWGIEADDSAGRVLSQTPAGTLLLGITALAAEQMAPVPLLALLKHPLAGGEGRERLDWLDAVRKLDLALRGPRPAAGLSGLDSHFEAKDQDRQFGGCLAAWQHVRPAIAAIETMIATPVNLAEFAVELTVAAGQLAGDAGWRGAEGRIAAELIADLQAAADPGIAVPAEDAVPILRQLMDTRSVRPPYGGHPRIFIWGLLEARLQHADLMVLGGLNEGVWPGVPSPDPWLAPKIRANLQLPSLDFRTGLAAHDFASALGAPRVLITRARRDSRSPTIPSRLWLRLQAMTGGLARDHLLERIATSLDDPGSPRPADRPAPSPPARIRPKRISVTSVDRLKADPFAFYAQAMLGLRKLDAVDADHSAAWKGTAVHEVFQYWLRQDDCDPEKLRPRAEALLRGETIHPMLRALWAPRLLEAIEALVELERTNRSNGRKPLVAEASGEAELAGVTVYGRVDRIDRLQNGGLAIIDYKTGAPPSNKAVGEGFALQLGLLAQIACAGGFEGISGNAELFEYWTLSKRLLEKNPICPNKDRSPEEFLAEVARHFSEAAGKWLTGDAPFTAKLNPAYAPWGDYDQLMRLEEWYGRK